MAESVKVAVRVRPFNSREKERNASLIINMVNNTTEIKNPENPKEEPKRFTFDYSYWSHDEFKERSDGYLEPAGKRYADQTIVFDDLGKGVLKNAWEGFNCSLFAYGQTGSGKSYSMVGYGTNKGIVPISCEQLFSAIEQKRGENVKGQEFQVSFSMMEIYNEQVRDLLNPASLKVKGGLKVRQHPAKGFYVDNLKTMPVNSYKEIDSKMEEGTKNRTVASTAMNATSSRAHTIVAINFTQKQNNDLGESMTKSAIINLVDLAGSERAESTGATGDRLKEGSAINQSLSVLGNCIKALADLSQGKKGTMVPFRDSVLTKLLKNALGGNSKTIMIAALSPADINYEETLSTLRFADRAKAIKTKATVNESPTDKLIRELKEENARLMAALKTGGVPEGVPDAGGAPNAQEVEEMKKEMEEQMKQNQEEMERMKKSWEQQLQERENEYQAELKAKEDRDQKKKVTPHLWNLNEDNSLSGMIVHFVEEGTTRIGNAKADPKPEIVLGGLGIQSQHAVLTSKKGQVHFAPCKGVKVLLNGNEISDKKELHHNDRLMFGSNTLFVFHHPQDAKAFEKKSKKKPTPPPTYEAAQQEIAENSGLNKLMKGGKSKEDLLLQEDLVQLWPMIKEAVAMSEEMDKKCNFEIALVSPQGLGKKHGRTEVCVKMKNLTNDNEFLWDRNKFINRKFLMTEMYQNFVNGESPDVPKEVDPFWEPSSTEILIGTVHVYLQSTAYLIEIEETLNISDYRGVERGCLGIEVWPCNKKGEPMEDDVFVDQPEELIGTELNFKMKINHARGLPPTIATSFCKYRMYLDSNPVETNKIEGTINPDFKHEKIFTFNPVTQQLVEYLKGEPLVVEIWGCQKGLDQTNTLNTHELMLRDKTLLGPGSVKEREEYVIPEEVIKSNLTTCSDCFCRKKVQTSELKGVADLQYKMAVEASTYRRRMERAEDKLRKIKQLMRDASAASSSAVPVEALQTIISSGSRLRAVAKVIAQTKKAEKMAGGKVTSQACSLQ